MSIKDALGRGKSASWECSRCLIYLCVFILIHVLVYFLHFFGGGGLGGERGTRGGRNDSKEWTLNKHKPRVKYSNCALFLRKKKKESFLSHRRHICFAIWKETQRRLRRPHPQTLCIMQNDLTAAAHALVVLPWKKKRKKKKKTSLALRGAAKEFRKQEQSSTSPCAKGGRLFLQLERGCVCVCVSLCA